jgi:serine/threonine protein kinase
VVIESHPRPEALQAFAQGKGLSQAELSAIEKHVLACDSCCQFVLQEQSADPLVVLAGQTGTAAPTVAPLGAETAIAPSPTASTAELVPAGPAAPAAAGRDDPAELPAGLQSHERYRVLRRLGSGGMGTVYQAEHCVMQRLVALKVIRPRYTADPAAVERFQREVHAAARLIHPNIVIAYDAEQASANHFLVMEYIEGNSLAELLKERGPLPVAEACDYVRQAALGLQHAHERGLVHRDVKPDNLMRTAEGTVKVLDFGLAALTAERTEGDALTGARVVMGTPDYVAPEQANDAHTVDGRADVYSLGCTLYELLSGQVPYPGGGLLDKLRRHALEQPEPLTRLRPEVPAELAAVVERMMAKDPAVRSLTPARVAAALEPFCQPRHLRWRDHRSWRWGVAVAGLLAVAGGVGVALFPQREKEHRKGVISSANPSLDDPVVDPPNLDTIVPVLDDDFSALAKDVLDRYPQEDRKEQKVGVENGRFVVQLLPFQGGPTNCRFHWIANRWRVDEGDFACEVVGRIATGGDHGWALCLISPDRDRDLAIRMSRDGLLEVGNINWKDGILPKHLIKPLKPSALQSSDSFNTLRVICRGGRRLELFVNGSLTGQPILLDPPFLPVYPGLAVWQRGRGTQEVLRAEFSRFRVWQLGKVPPGPVPPDLAKLVPVRDADFRNSDKHPFPPFKDDPKGIEMEFANDRCVMRLFPKPRLGATHYAYCTLPELAVGDCAFRVTGRVLTGPENGWALGLRTPKLDKHLAVRVRWDRAVEVGNLFWDKDGSTTTVGPIRDPAIRPGAELNTLLVVLRGGQSLELYVNDSAISQPIRLDKPLEAAWPCLVAWQRDVGAQKEGRVEFSEFKQWSLPLPPAGKP